MSGGRDGRPEGVPGGLPGVGPEGEVSLEELRQRVRTAKAAPVYGHDSVISCDRLVRIFTADRVEVQALQGLDLLVEKGDLVALVGASGSGKSTLLNILAGLDVPSAGSAAVAGCDLLSMTAKERLRYRREVVGFVWQQTARNLMPFLTAAQNVALPMQLNGERWAAAGPSDRLPEPMSCWTRSASRGWPTGGSPSSPAASSSGWRSPSRWPTTLGGAGRRADR